MSSRRYVYDKTVFLIEYLSTNSLKGISELWKKCEIFSRKLSSTIRIYELYRYCFLAFGYDERVVANRDNCRLLLIRLKMDGWALGKTKVFLKYYHVEFLSKLYEEQLRKIIMVQACVRRWLAKIKFKKQKWQFAVSVVTLQRHIRGWLSRKRTEEMLVQKRTEEENMTFDFMSSKFNFELLIKSFFLNSSIIIYIFVYFNFLL